MGADLKGPRALEEFGNGVFTLITHQIFSVHTTREKYQNATITDPCGFLLEETRGNHTLSYLISFRKAPFQNVFRSHENKQLAFSNSYDLESVFRNALFL